MHYEEAIQLIEAYKQNPIQGTIILVAIVVFFIDLAYVDRKGYRKQDKF